MKYTRVNKPFKGFKIGTFRYWIGKWSYGVSLTQDYRAILEGKRFNLWCFKLVDLPEQGEMLQRGKHFKGINWSIGIMFNFYFY